jgi:hypothetical protein
MAIYERYLREKKNKKKSDYNNTKAREREMILYGVHSSS